MTANLKPMSQASEDRIMSALDTVASLTQSGEDPSKAVAKAAKSHNVPAGHLPILCRAYNTAQAALKRASGEDAWERATAFPLADADKAKDMLYPATIEKAADIVDPIYSRPPTFVKERELAAEKAWLKEAKLDYGPKYIPPPACDDKARLRRCYDVERCKRAADNARANAQRAFDLADQVADELTEAMKSSNTPGYQETYENCLALHGDRVQPLFDKVLERDPDLRTKRSAYAGPPRPARGLVYDLVLKALTSKTAFDSKRQEWLDKLAEATASEGEYESSFDEPEPTTVDHPVLGTVPFHKSVPLPAIPSIADNGDEKSDDKEATASRLLLGLPSRKSAGLTGLLASQAGSLVPKPNISGPKPPDAGNISSSPGMLSHDAELDSIHRESLLHDLMSNDEVIQGHDPRKVIEAYRDFNTLAPQASKQRALMADYVRKRLEGGPLSYFDLKSLTDIESNLHNTNESYRNNHED